MATTEQTVVLVTGASSGIGQALSLILAKKGYRVYGTTRKPDRFPIDNPPFEVVALDADSNESVKAAIASILEKEGKIDVVVNNAGYAIMGPIEDSTDEDAKKVFETNVFGVLRIIRAVLPSMRERKQGKIINVSSIAGRFGLPFRGIYSSSKWALEGIIESLQYEVEPFNIKVVIFEPGDVATNINANRGVATGTGSDGAYTKVFEHMKHHINEGVSTGYSAERVAGAIVKIIENPNPRLRYICGPFLQKLAVGINHLVPSGLFKWIIKKNAGI